MEQPVTFPMAFDGFELEMISRHVNEVDTTYVHMAYYQSSTKMESQLWGYMESVVYKGFKSQKIPFNEWGSNEPAWGKEYRGQLHDSARADLADFDLCLFICANYTYSDSGVDPEKIKNIPRKCFFHC